MLTPTDFRTTYPAFADTTVYSDPEVTNYLNFAYLMLRPERWMTTLDFGVGLFVQHFLAVDRISALNGGMGGIPGSAVGVLSGGTVDKVSYTKDVASIMEPDAGHWGMTTFGLQFIRIARMMGAGPIQIGIGGGYDIGQSASLYSGAWPGPGIPGYW